MASPSKFRGIPLVLALLLCAGGLAFPVQSQPSPQAAQPQSLPPFALPLLEGQQVKVEVGNAAPTPATTFWGADAAYVNFSVWWWDNASATNAFLYLDSVPYLMTQAPGNDGVSTNGTLYQIKVKGSDLAVGFHAWYYSFTGPSGSARLPAAGTFSNLLVAPVERFLDSGIKLAAQTTLAQGYAGGALPTLRDVALAAGQWADATMASAWDTTTGYPYGDLDHFILTPVALSGSDREVFVDGTGAQHGRYADSGLYTNNSQPALKQALVTRALLLATGLFNASDLRIRLEAFDLGGNTTVHPFLTVRLNDGSELSGDGAADGDSLIDIDTWGAGLPAGLNVSWGKHFMDDGVASNDGLWAGNSTWPSTQDFNSAVAIWPFSSSYNVTAPDGTVTNFVVVEGQLHVAATTPRALDTFWTDSAMVFDGLASAHDSYLDMRYTWNIPSTILAGAGPVWMVGVTIPGSYTVDLTVTDPFGDQSVIGIPFTLRAKTHLKAPVTDVEFSEDGQGSLNLQFFFADDDGFSSIQFGFSVTPAQIHVSRTGTSPLLVFTADRYWCGSGSGYVNATDTFSPLIEQWFNITVTCVNNPPVAVDIPASVEFNEDSTYRLLNLSTRVTDADGDPMTWSFVGQHTSAVFDPANNSLNFAAEPDWNGADPGNLSVHVGPDWIYTTLTVIVRPVNDPPQAVRPLPDISINEDAANTTFPLSDYFTDKDDAALSAEVSAGTGLVAGYFPPLRNVWFYPAANFTGASTVHIRVWDAANASLEGTFAVTVNPVNDAPTITAAEPSGYVTATEGDAITFVVQAADSDSTVITYTFAVDGVTLGSGFVSSFNWQTGFSSAGRHEVTVSAADDQGASTTYKWTVQVADKNRAPVVSIVLPSGDNHTANSQIPLEASATDLDGDALSYSWSFGGVVQPQTGRAVNVSFTSAGDYTARVTVTDGKASASATVILHITFTLPPPPTGNNTTNPPVTNPSPGPEAAAAVGALGLSVAAAVFVRRRRA